MIVKNSITAVSPPLFHRHTHQHLIPGIDILCLHLEGGKAGFTLRRSGRWRTEDGLDHYARGGVKDGGLAPVDEGNGRRCALASDTAAVDIPGVMLVARDGITISASGWREDVRSRNHSPGR